VARREVLTANGEPLAYDLLSLDIGSDAGEPSGCGGARASRPPDRRVSRGLGALARVGGERRDPAHRGGRRRRGRGRSAPRHAARARRSRRGIRDVQRAAPSSQVTTGTCAAGSAASSALAASPVHCGRKVVALGKDALELDGGERFQVQAAVWATGASAPSWIARSGLATDPLGFVAVSDTLQSRSCPEIFAAGDVASVIGEPGPKSGVFAVRQGPVLARNLRLALAEKAPEAFRPPSRSLALISCGDRYALASWGRIAVEGAWVVALEGPHRPALCGAIPIRNGPKAESAGVISLASFLRRCYR